MDLGTRIQGLRKARNLSQESLAEQMGLSRQAIGKWESGASAPSLDNLMELSEILQTTADYLLTGREPTVAENASDQTVSVDAVKALLEKEHRHRPINRGLVAFCVAAVLIMLWFYMEFDRKIEHIQTQQTVLDAAVDDLNFFHKADINSLEEKLAAPAAAPTLLSDYSVTHGAYDPQKDTVSLSLTAIPQTVTADTRVYFSLLPMPDSEDTLPNSVSVEASSAETGVFTAETEIPLVENFNVYVMVEQSGILQTQYVTGIYGLVSDYRCSLSAERGDFVISWYNSGVIALSGRPAVTVRPAENQSHLPQTLTCTLYVDESALWTETYDLDEFNSAEDGIPIATEATYYPGEGTYEGFPHDGDPQVKWVFTMTDSSGQVYEDVLTY